jgi:GTP-binding protein Era
VTEGTHRSGVIALAGRPNVGKSTLVNRLVGAHVAAVSAKPQTTRRRIVGVVNRPGVQLVLADLPGFQRPFDRLTERMQHTVDAAIADADVTVLVLDGTVPPGPGDRHIAARLLRPDSAPCILAVNKVDLLKRPATVVALAAAAALGDPHSVHPVSARTGSGVDALVEDVASLLPPGPEWFPPGVTTDQPLEHVVAEMVREAALELTRDEVPHAVAVEADPVRRGKGRLVVDARIICETESQKRILVGHGGAMVTAIGTAARPGVEVLLGEPVYLALQVKVRPHWRRDAAQLDRLGV